MGEFGVVLMVGGNIPGVTRTVSIEIYDQVQAANYAAANHTALVLVMIAFAVVSLVYAVYRGAWNLWPWKSGPGRSTAKRNRAHRNGTPIEHCVPESRRHSLAK